VGVATWGLLQQPEIDNKNKTAKRKMQALFIHPPYINRQPRCLGVVGEAFRFISPPLE
jgi:hypothetical protein